MMTNTNICSKATSQRIYLEICLLFFFCWALSWSSWIQSTRSSHCSFSTDRSWNISVTWFALRRVGISLPQRPLLVLLAYRINRHIGQFTVQKTRLNLVKVIGMSSRDTAVASMIRNCCYEEWLPLRRIMNNWFLDDKCLWVGAVFGPEIAAWWDSGIFVMGRLYVSSLTIHTPPWTRSPWCTVHPPVC